MQYNTIQYNTKSGLSTLKIGPPAHNFSCRLSPFIDRLRAPEPALKGDSLEQHDAVVRLGFRRILGWHSATKKCGEVASGPLAYSGPAVS